MGNSPMLACLSLTAGYLRPHWVFLLLTAGAVLPVDASGNEGGACEATAAGWTPVAPSAGVFGCDIDVREAGELSLAAFAAEYAGKRPVLIRGAAAAWPAQRRWTRPFLAAALRWTHTLPPGFTGVFPTPLADGEANPRGLELALRPSTSAEQPYFFRRITRNGTIVREDDGAAGDTAAAEGAVEARRGWVVPMEDLGHTRYFRDWFAPPPDSPPAAEQGEDALVERLCDTFLSMGGEGSGLKMHAHESFWAGLIWGRKHWLLCPPGAGYEECRESVNQESANDLGIGESAALKAWAESGAAARVGALQCFQEKGDVLYAPAETGHAVWNHGECVSLSHVYGAAYGD
jgi:hypothetical protein